MAKKLTIISYILFFVPLTFIMNFFFDMITFSKIQGLVVFSPIVFCSTGLFLASIAYRHEKSFWALGSVIANAILLVFPFLYMIGGVLFFGV